MTITTMTAREFNQDISRAKTAALEGPVFITDRGEHSHVLLGIDEYLKLTRTGMSALEAIAQKDIPGVNMDSEYDFDPPQVKVDGKWRNAS